jgi:GNAT superfamily N-acetyltransferase
VDHAGFDELTMASGSVTIEALSGDRLLAALPDLARLRITVFRDWPYLYDGTAAYEQDYLAHFVQGHDAVIIAAVDGHRMVGAATASPLISHTEEFAPLFRANGYDPQRIFYLGESVLLPEYRGQGIGHAFFDGREAKARETGSEGGPYTHTAFCAVVRAEDDFRRPPGYRPLNAFWHKRGYAPVPGLVGSFAWREVGTTEETTQPMQFWLRPL